MFPCSPAVVHVRGARGAGKNKKDGEAAISEEQTGESR